MSSPRSYAAAVASGGPAGEVGERPRSFLGDLRVVLRGKDFRRLFAVRLTSQGADGVFQVALASYVFFSPERQTSAADAAAAFAALLLPYSLVGPFAGVLLDRWRRRQVLVWANVTRTFLVLGVAALVIGGATGPGFYAAVLSVLSVNRFLLAGLGASLPHVVPRHELVMANAVSPTSGTVAALLGAAAGYGLQRVVGGPSAGDVAELTVLVTAAAVYLAAGVLALRMHPDLLGPDDVRATAALGRAFHQVARGMVEGARHVVGRRRAAYGLAAIGAHRFAYGISTIATILLYRNYFNDPADVDAGLAGLGLAFAVSGVGFAAAAVITPVVTRRLRKEAWVTLLLATAAVVEVFPGALYTEASLLVAALFLGVASQGIKICVDTLVQEDVDDAFRGRVFSFYDVVFNVAFVAAAGFAAATLPPSGKSYPVLAVIALGYAVTALGYGRASATLGRTTPETVG